MPPTIRHKYNFLHSTVQTAKDRRQKFHFCRLPFDVRPRNVKLNLSIFSNVTSVPAAIVYSLPSSQRIPWIHYIFPLDANVGQFLSLLVAFKNTKTSRHSEIKHTRPSTKQDFSVFRGSIHGGLTSLTFMQLVPGADRLVRHICIRCYSQ